MITYAKIEWFDIESIPEEMKDGRDVAVYTSFKNKEIACWKNDCWWSDSWNSPIKGDVTHYYPLPYAPHSKTNI